MPALAARGFWVELVAALALAAAFVMMLLTIVFSLLRA